MDWGDVFGSTWDQIIEGAGDLIFNGGDSANGLNLDLLIPLLITGVGQNQGWWDTDPPKIGYQGKIPRYDTVQRDISINNANAERMPGEYGLRHFTQNQYVPQDDPEAMAAAIARRDNEYDDLLYHNRMREEYAKPVTTNMQNSYEDFRRPLYQQSFATGGIVDMYTPQPDPRGQGFYVDGPGDGMSDSVPADMGGIPAALGDGEFVVPADVVSHLGNGSSNAGAERLQEMMNRVRTARTGSHEQGKRINPSRYMPG